MCDARTTGEREARIAEIEDDIRELAEKRQAHVEAAESYSETAAKQADEYMRSFYEERASRHNVRAAFWGRIMSRLSELSSARKDAEACMRFAGRALEEVRGEWGAGDWDGGDLQDAMEKCGIIESREVVEPCGEDCSCAEWGFPMRCYFESSLGTRCRELAATSRSEETRT